MAYDSWKAQGEGFKIIDVRGVAGNFLEMVKVYALRIDSAALDDVFELLAWNQR